MSEQLKGKTAFITGATRGIGREIALMLARQGANIVVVGTTDIKDDRKEGTIHDTAAEIAALGAHALAVRCDVRCESEVEAAIAAAVTRFGGIDILINNASALDVSPIQAISPKRARLIMEVNYFGTLWCCKYARPHLLASGNGHILTLSPPLNMDAHWFEDHLPYTISKYNMSMITFGLARSLAVFGVAVNSLWPETAIDTAAIRMLEKLSKKPMVKHSRKPAIVADAARWILSQPSRQCTGNFFTDAQVLTASGITDLSGYATSPGEPLLLDYFRPWPSPEFKS